MMPLLAVDPTIWFAIVPVILVFVVFGVAAATLARPWLQAWLSGTPISLADLIGMKLRRTDVDQIVRARVLAAQGGVSPLEVDLRRLEAHHLAGGDVLRLCRAWVAGLRAGGHPTFDQLAAWDLAGKDVERLATMSLAKEAFGVAVTTIPTWGSIEIKGQSVPAIARDEAIPAGTVVEVEDIWGDVLVVRRAPQSN